MKDKGLQTAKTKCSRPDGANRGFKTPGNSIVEVQKVRAVEVLSVVAAIVHEISDCDLRE